MLNVSITSIVAIISQHIHKSNHHAVHLCCCLVTESCPTLLQSQAPLSLEFSRQEYWSGLPFPSPGDLPDPGIEPTSPALAGGFFTIWATGKPAVHLSYIQFSFVQYTPITLDRKGSIYLQTGWEGGQGPLRGAETFMGERYSSGVPTSKLERAKQ